MEKLNNESDVSRETSKKEIKIVFKNSFMDIISTHRMEINDMDSDMEKAKSYATDLLQRYAQDAYFVIYDSDGLAVWMS